MDYGDQHNGRDLASMVQRHERDLYRGNGKPSLTVRMELMENAIENLLELEEAKAKKQDRIQMLVWAALITGIANLVFSHLK